MFDSIKRSWVLTQESFKVLMQDKELMMFPVISAILTVLVVASFIVPAALFYGAIDAALGLDGIAEDLAGIILIFCVYFLSYFVIVFFNVAILQCARIRFDGGSPTMKDGWNAGMQNLGRIALWAALSGTIGVILSRLEEFLGEFVGGILRGLLGGAWTIITYFAIPVLIFEKTSPINAIKKSGQIIKETWGEGLTMYVGFNAIQTIFVLLTIIPLIGSIVLSVMANSFVIFAIMGSLVVLSWIIMAVVFSALGQIFRAALYIYATTGTVPSCFTESNIKDAFQVKKK